MGDVQLTQEGEAGSDSFYDEAFSLLADARRRGVVRHLHESGGPVELSELAFAVAASDTKTPVSKVPMETARRVRTSLYHAHLPKLEAMDVIAFDQDGGTIEASENLPVLMSILKML